MGFKGIKGGHWTQDSGMWTLDTGQWTLDSGMWTLDRNGIKDKIADSSGFKCEQCGKQGNVKMKVRRHVIRKHEDMS